MLQIDAIQNKMCKHTLKKMLYINYTIVMYPIDK